MRTNTILMAAKVAVALLLSGPGVLAGDGIVRSIVKAPIVPDGNVAGAVTELVINLEASLDPAVAGRELLSGNTIRVTLPEGFVNTNTFPLLTVGSDPACAPGNLLCNTAVLLHGWPQNPLPPPNYPLSLDGNTLVFTAAADLLANPPGAPGIKQIHLIFQGFLNPGPGSYAVTVEAQTGPGGDTETGSGRLNIVPRVRPSINVTSGFADNNPNPPNPNTIYQTTLAGAAAPLPWDFLLWDRNGEPFTGVDIQMVNVAHYRLLKGRKTVGHVFVNGPAGATGQAIVAKGPSFEIPSTPVIGPSLATARLTARFFAGDLQGRYSATWKLNNGNSVEMFVDVE